MALTHSPARQHYQRVRAAQLAANKPAGTDMAGASDYELMLAKLTEDRRVLHGVQSIEEKARVKMAMLPAYEPWVSGVLESGKGSQDDVLMTVMVWRLDAGDIDGALDIVEYALAHDLSMPDQYKRTVATVVAEEVADQALKAMNAGKAIDASVLERTESLIHDFDMPDEVRAKLHKAIGEAMRETRPQEALDNFKRAMELNDRAGVKRDIEQLERQLKKES